MRVRQVLLVFGAVLGIALLTVNAILTFQVLETLRADTNKTIDVAVDWQNQRQVAVDIANVSLNADMYSDVPTGFLPVMSAWQLDDDGKPVHLDLDVTVRNSQLRVWVDGGDVAVTGNVTVDGGWIYVDNFP